MRQTLAEIDALEAVGAYLRVRLTAPDIVPVLQPGRAILARSPASYLRRTWWPSALGSSCSILLDGAQAGDLRNGDRIDLIGPVGRGFRLDDAGRNLLLVAAHGCIGPLLPLIDRALAGGRSVTLASADEDRAFPVSALPPVIELIRAADADLIDLLPDAIAWADQIFICGPDGFTARLADRIHARRYPAPRGFAQALQPIDLPCGVGACNACWRDGKLACVDGPVFELTSSPVKSQKT
jgi:dihydroorotate dehydrogenase electron transfer subunit